MGKRTVSSDDWVDDSGSGDWVDEAPSQAISPETQRNLKSGPQTWLPKLMFPFIPDDLSGVGRALPVMGGAMLGATAAAPAAEAATLATAPVLGPGSLLVGAGIEGLGAGAGAFGMDLNRLAIGQGLGLLPAQTAGQNFAEAGKTGAIAGATQAAFSGLIGGGKYWWSGAQRPPVNPGTAMEPAEASMGMRQALPEPAASTGAGPQIMAGLQSLGSQADVASAKIPGKYADAVWRDPDILNRAMTVDKAGEAYGLTTQGAGQGIGGRQSILNRDQFEQATGKMFPKDAPLFKLVENAILKLRSGTLTPTADGSAPHLGGPSLTLDEALLGRQAAANLLDRPMMAAPRAAMHRAKLIEAKNALDTYLEGGGIGIKQAGKDYFEANARAAYEQALPQNAHGRPDALRGMGMMGLAFQGVKNTITQGDPSLLLESTLMSPWVHGMAIKGAYNAAKAIGPVGASLFPFIPSATATAVNEKRPDRK